MDQRKKEIRTILMGFIRYQEEYIVAAGDVFQAEFRGLFQGASAARFRGLKEIRRQYKLTSGKVYGNMQIVNALLAMGHPVFLSSAPDASGILYRPLLFNPVMITVEAEKSDALFCFYTAKTLYATLNIRRVIKKLQASFPENFKPAPVTMTPVVLTEEKQGNEKPEEKQERTPKQKRTSKQERIPKQERAPKQERTPKKEQKKPVPETAAEKAAAEPDYMAEITEEELSVDDIVNEILREQSGKDS